MKYLVVTMPDNTMWKIPAYIIAADRAQYYEERDPGENPLDTYTEELRIALDDDYEIVDWASNNMNWSEVRAHAVRVIHPKEKLDYDREWSNADKEVLDG